MPTRWRTRADPLEAIWSTALWMLRDAPELEAKALFEHLAAGREDEIKPGLLRTFQRRVKAWRLKEGGEKEIFFTQEVKSGETLAVDWTDMKPLCITIQGRALDHKLFHAVLPYSKWEWAVRAQSESVLSLRAGLKAVLARLGRVERSAPSEADRRYLEILKVAADEGQTAVENALETILCDPRPVVSAAEVRAMLETWRDMEQEWRQRAPLEVSLAAYDALLESGESTDAEPLEPATTQNQEVARAC